MNKQPSKNPLEKFKHSLEHPYKQKTFTAVKSKEVQAMRRYYGEILETYNEIARTYSRR